MEQEENQDRYHCEINTARVRRKDMIYHAQHMRTTNNKFSIYKAQKGTG